MRIFQWCLWLLPSIPGKYSHPHFWGSLWKSSWSHRKGPEKLKTQQRNPFVTLSWLKHLKILRTLQQVKCPCWNFLPTTKKGLKTPPTQSWLGGMALRVKVTRILWPSKGNLLITAFYYNVPLYKLSFSAIPNKAKQHKGCKSAKPLRHQTPKSWELCSTLSAHPEIKKPHLTPARLQFILMTWQAKFSSTLTLL